MNILNHDQHPPPPPLIILHPLSMLTWVGWLPSQLFGGGSCFVFYKIHIFTRRIVIVSSLKSLLARLTVTVRVALYISLEETPNILLLMLDIRFLNIMGVGDRTCFVVRRVSVLV